MAPTSYTANDGDGKARQVRAFEMAKGQAPRASLGSPGALSFRMGKSSANWSTICQELYFTDEPRVGSPLLLEARTWSEAGCPFPPSPARRSPARATGSLRP